jgi:hypothetical protein
VIVTSNPAGFGLGQYVGSPLDHSFVVSGGDITSANFLSETSNGGGVFDIGVGTAPLTAGLGTNGAVAIVLNGVGLDPIHLR